DVLEHFPLVTELPVGEEPDLKLAGRQFLQRGCQLARGNGIRIHFAAGGCRADFELFRGLSLLPSTANQSGQWRRYSQFPESHDVSSLVECLIPEPTDIERPG